MRTLPPLPPRGSIAAGSLALLVLACSDASPPPPALGSVFEVSYVDAEAPFPRLRFGDGQLSLNDRCPVRRTRLTDRLPPIYVNGRPIGFC